MKEANLKTYGYRRITENKGAPRLWLQGSEPARAGFMPGKKYIVHIDTQRRMLTLSLVENGPRVVSRKKERNGTAEVPVIDLNSHDVLSIFDGVECVRVICSDRCIRILPAVTEVKRRERLDRIARKMANGEPISVGSLTHGVGVLSLALHKGMQAEGLSSKLAFANDIREDHLDQASRTNEAWSEDTIRLAAPLQELMVDRWTLDHLPQVDALEAGLACSGASVAGRAKLGTACAEAHPDVGHLVVGFLQVISAVNPAVVILENVKPYFSSASMWIIRHSLRDMGYDVHETVLDAAEFNELEHRERGCMVAVTQGMSFSFDELEKPEKVERKLGEILDPVPDGDPRWSEFAYLKRHQEKHAAKGNGFQMQVFGAESDHVGTITKGYAKIRSTDPKIAHESKPELMRQLSPAEHARAKGISESLVEGMTLTHAHEVLGQSICFAPFVAVGKLLARTLRKPIEATVRLATPDLLAAA